MSAASPGVVAVFFRNDHYPSQEAYLYAIADAMRHEYEAVAKAGFVLQLDCPDLAMGRHIQFHDVDLKTFRKAAEMNIEVMNHATANIPPEQLRMHVCWGNYEGPHHYDVPLADVIDLVFKARASYISFEAANPRHAHEWTLFESVKLPDGKVLIPGVIEFEGELHRASGADRAAHRPLRQAGRPRERHGRQRLRLRHLGRAGGGRSGRGVGEARGARRRRAHREQGILEIISFLRTLRPHPEERARACAGRVLEGWPRARRLRPSFETSLRFARSPQDEGRATTSSSA